MGRSKPPERQAAIPAEYLEPESGKHFFSIMYERWDNLGEREKEVARLIAHGKSIKDIANQLGTQPRTIENQRNHAYRKLGISKDTELTRIVIYIDEKKWEPGI